MLQFIEGIHFRHHHFHKLLHRTETCCSRQIELLEQKAFSDQFHKSTKISLFLYKNQLVEMLDPKKLVEMKMRVGGWNYQNRLVECPGISSWLLPRTLNFLGLNNDLGAISISTNTNFLLQSSMN